MLLINMIMLLIINVANKLSPMLLINIMLIINYAANKKCC